MNVSRSPTPFVTKFIQFRRPGKWPANQTSQLTPPSVVLGPTFRESHMAFYVPWDDTLGGGKPGTVLPLAAGEDPGKNTAEPTHSCIPSILNLLPKELG